MRFPVNRESLRAGRVLSTSFQILVGNFPKYMLFGAGIALPDGLLRIYTDRLVLRHNEMTGHGLTWILIGIPLLLLYAISQSAMTYGAFQDIRGRPFALGASFRRGLKRFIPVLGAVICALILILGGLVLLIVPGIFALTVIFVFVPVCVVEGCGPLRSLERSRELTKDYRWRILVLWLLPLLIVLVVESIGQVLSFAAAGATGAALTAFIVTAVGGSYQAIVNLVTYQDLRSIKEGPDKEQLAVVFD
jgi:hypothetical protein